jgi:hypothetical protein
LPEVWLNATVVEYTKSKRNVKMEVVLMSISKDFGKEGAFYVESKSYKTVHASVKNLGGCADLCGFASLRERSAQGQSEMFHSKPQSREVNS